MPTAIELHFDTDDEAADYYADLAANYEDEIAALEAADAPAREIAHARREFHIARGLARRYREAAEKQGAERRQAA